MLIDFENKNIEFNWSEIEIRSKNYGSGRSKAANYSGKLKFIFGGLGVIYKIKIEFNDIGIDLLTTASWFKSKTNFKLREKLFSKLELKQEPRLEKNLNKIKQLNKAEIEKVNEFINNTNEYSSTIKNINALFSGNNPSGERKNPKASPLFGIHNNKNYNIATFFKFYYFDKNHITDKDAKDIFGFSKIDFEDYLTKHLPTDSRESFLEFQKPSSPEGWKKARMILEKNLSNNKDIIKVVESCVKRARTKFNNAINFEVFPIRTFTTQKAHIVPVYYLKRKMIESKIKKDDKEFTSYQNDISNVDNYLNLVYDLHRLFDEKSFTYSQNGEIQILEENKQYKINELNQICKKIFSKIPEKFLNGGRLDYLKKRQKWLNEEKDKITK